MLWETKECQNGEGSEVGVCHLLWANTGLGEGTGGGTEAGKPQDTRFVVTVGPWLLKPVLDAGRPGLCMGICCISESGEELLKCWAGNWGHCYKQQ